MAAAMANNGDNTGSTVPVISSDSQKQQSVSLVEYMTLLSKFQNLQEQFNQVISLRKSEPPQEPLLRLHDHRSPSTDSNDESISDNDDHHDDDDETSSVELDDNGDPVTTYRPVVSQFSSFESGSFHSKESQSIKTIDTSHISTEIYSRILNENKRLKRTLASDRLQWNQDNSRGRDTIQKLQIDVAKLKYERQISMDKLPKDLEAQAKKFKDEKALMSQQMQAFQDDFERERNERKNAVKKLEEFLAHYKKNKEETEVLRKNNKRYQEQMNILRKKNEELKKIAESSQRALREVQQFYGTSSYRTPPPADRGVPSHIATGIDKPISAMQKMHLPMSVMCDSAVEDIEPESKDELASPTKLEKIEHLKDEDDNVRPDPAGQEVLRKLEDEKRNVSERTSDEES